MCNNDKGKERFDAVLLTMLGDTYLLKSLFLLYILTKFLYK